MTRALTLHQPWASLVALGVKSIETRSWATSYRGPLLIHASARMVDPATVGDWIVHRTIGVVPWMVGPDALERGTHDLPLGAIVASCTLADCVPIREDEAALSDKDPDRVIAWDEDGVLRDWRRFHHVAPHTCVDGWAGDGWPADQAPYGDFAPGRFAWLLEDVKPTTDRCPACWGEGRPVLAVNDRHQPVGGGKPCPTCSGEGRCDPVPARGRQRLWEWTP